MYVVTVSNCVFEFVQLCICVFVYFMYLCILCICVFYVFVYLCIYVFVYLCICVFVYFMYLCICVFMHWKEEAGWKLWVEWSLI